ncbi:chemotaxis protein CheA [bacterium]|nr:chemotaxis protein CheA [bacterium]
MHDIFDEYKIAFLEETLEHLHQLNDDLIALEKNHNDSKLIDSIFRVMHTLKSSAAAVGYDDLGIFAHQAEDLVQQIRNKTLKITQQIVNVLFQAFDTIQNYIDAVQSGDNISENHFENVLSHIKKSTSHKKQGTRKPDISGSAAAASPENWPKSLIEAVKKLQGSRQHCYEIRIEIDPAEPLKWLRAELVINHALKTGKIIHISPDKSTFQSDSFTGTFTLFLVTDKSAAIVRKKMSIDLINITTFKNVSVDDSAASDKTRRETGDEQSSFTQIKSGSSTNTIRVPVRKLDQIMHLAGELVVANSSLRILEKKIREIHRDDAVYHEMNQIVETFAKLSTALQSRILKTRMLPIHTLFNQYHRVVRDLSLKESKEIDLIIRGEETELDKKVIDAMGDPLTHLIRNAVDHGIETPEKRMKSGKPRRGMIELSASQAGNHVIISVKDDGRGLDLEKIKSVAVKEGYFEEAIASELLPRDVFNVIFEPGFSTAEKISSVSGRGVGLDVVNNIISSLNGSVQIESSDQGTEFIITMPLTLAISTVIVVEAGKSAYGIPISDIQKTIKVPANLLKSRASIQALNWSNQIIPIMALSQILDSESRKLPVDIHGNVSVIVVKYRDREIGLIVDNILGKQEIVMKPLEEHYKAIRGISGAAILGDGTVILIADILGMLQIVREVEENVKKKHNKK